MEHTGKGLRKRTCKNMDYAEKKLKKDSGNLVKSPLFGPSSSPIPNTFADSGLARSPFFGGKAEKTIIGINELMVASYRNACIIGRVSFIGDVTNWDNGRSQGKVASFGIADQENEISVSLFNDKVDESYNLLQINQVVKVSGFRVKAVEEKYQKVPGQWLEIVLEYSGSILESSEDVHPITFNFLDILKMHSLPLGSLVDFLGIAYDDKGFVEGTSNAGKHFAFKTFVVTDKTEMQYSVKIWGEQARTLILEKPTVFVLRRGKLESYESEKYINISRSSMFWIDPPIPEASQLKDWLKSRLP